MKEQDCIKILGIVKECPYEEFIFDTKSLEKFKEFWREIIPPPIENINDWASKCPFCLSINCHKYKDKLVCFDCKSKWELPLFKLKIYRGYLIKYKIDNPKDFLYFHRFLMEKELKRIYGDVDKFVVHHINQNKKDNRFSNLTIMTEQEHKQHHSREAYYRGLSTYCEKKYGELQYCGEYEEEYNEWLANKFDSYKYE